MNVKLGTLPMRSYPERPKHGHPAYLYSIASGTYEARRPSAERPGVTAARCRVVVADFARYSAASRDAR
jgi:hypothetical protein